MTNKKVPVSFS